MAKEWRVYNDRPRDRQIVLTARMENGRIKYEVLRYLEEYKAYLPPRSFNRKNAIRITFWQEIEHAPFEKINRY